MKYIVTEREGIEELFVFLKQLTTIAWLKLFVESKITLTVIGNASLDALSVQDLLMSEESVMDAVKH